MRKKLLLAAIAILITSFTPHSTHADQHPLPTLPAWKQSIIKIEEAKASGRITIDEAALLRLRAISAIDLLPLEYRPASNPDKLAETSPQAQIDHRGGWGELASRLDALFIDQEYWSPQTRDEIFLSFELGAESERVASIDLDQEHITDHFVIHWTDNGPSAPSAGLVYIETIADALENAWTTLEGLDYGYEMPDPGEFGRIPHPDDGISRFDIFVGADIKICNLITIDRGGVALPGVIKLKNDTVLDKLETLAVHEWFHMMQWNYAGYRDSGCFGMLNAYTWYSSEGAWLMESTARWIEDELYPANNDYLYSIPSFMRSPEVSLFARSGSHEYGAVVFIKFLQERLAGPAGYSRNQDIIREIWERVPLEGSSTVDAVTYVLMHPPSGASPYVGFVDTWTSIFDDFAIANLTKDYTDGPLWIKGSDVAIVDSKKPVADPLIPMTGYQSGFGWPAAQYVEVFPDDINLPGGADSTGATLELEFTTSCSRCTLDILGYKGSALPARSKYDFNEIDGSFPPTFEVIEDIASDFGAPGGTERLVLVFVNPVYDPGSSFEYTFTAIDNPPKAPENLDASANPAASTIELDWDPLEEDQISYRLYRSLDSPVETIIDNLLAETQGTAYADTSAEPGETYYYVLTAVDSGGNEGPISNEVYAMLPLPTPTPSPTPSTGYFLDGPYTFTISTSLHQQYGYHTVAVDQPPDTAFAGIVIYTDYHKTGYKASEDLGYTPSLHGSSSPWDYGAGWYCYDSNHIDDRESCTFAANELGETLRRTRPLSYWVRSGYPGATAYSSFFIESTPCCEFPPVTGNLQVYYVWNGTIPSPTPTPTPTITPTPTPTSTPVPTPQPCKCGILCVLRMLLGSAQVSDMSVASHGSGVLAKYLQQTSELWDGVELLQELRDQIMVHSPEGQRYIDLYVDNSPEIAALLVADSDLRQEGFDTIDLFRPGFQALLEDRGAEIIITAEQVLAVEQFLGHLASSASPELAQILADERNANPLDQFTGETMNEALAVLTDNEPPVADAGSGYTVLEGDAIDLLSTATDPEGDPLTFEWDFNNDGQYEALGEQVTFSAVGLNGPSVQVVSLRVCDDKVGCSVSQTTVQILNAEPIVAAGDDLQVDEGMPISFEGVFVDYGLTDTHVIEWNFDDGIVTLGTLTPSHTFADDGTYQVMLTIADDDGGVGSSSLVVAVGNVAPAVSVAGDEINEGELALINAEFSDPGVQDTHTARVTWGDGSPPETTPVVEDQGLGSVSADHEFVEDGFYTGEICVLDDDGDETCSSFGIVVNNLPPLVVAGPDQLSNEGDLFRLTDASFQDAGVLDTHTSTINWGDGTPIEALAVNEQSGVGSLIGEHSYIEDGIYLLEICVTDDDGASSCDTKRVDVRNLAPTVNAGADQTIYLGVEVSFTGSFFDAGIEDTHTVAWDFGDGTIIEGELTPTHVYGTKGVYITILRVTDDDGDQGIDEAVITVIEPSLNRVVLNDERSERCMWIDLESGAYYWFEAEGEAFEYEVEIISLRHVWLFRSMFSDPNRLRGLVIRDRQGVALFHIKNENNWTLSKIIDRDISDQNTCP